VFNVDIVFSDETV